MIETPGAEVIFESWEDADAPAVAVCRPGTMEHNEATSRAKSSSSSSNGSGSSHNAASSASGANAFRYLSSE